MEIPRVSGGLEGGSSSRPPDPPPLSFAAVVGRQKQDAEHHQATIPIKKPATYKGEPALFFSEDETKLLAAPHRLSLVAKCSYGRPSLDVIKTFMKKSAGIRLAFSVGILDSRHLLFRFSSEEDYLMIWIKEVIYINGFLFRFFKWTPSFVSGVEPSIVPIWVSFPNLPLHLFNDSAIRSIGSIIGKVLKLDGATQSFSRPSVARACIEVDLLKQNPERFWLGIGDQGRWQAIEYEKTFLFCKNCKKLGHGLHNCSAGKNKGKIRHAENNKGEEEEQFKNSKRWVIKQSAPIDTSSKDVPDQQNISSPTVIEQNMEDIYVREVRSTPKTAMDSEILVQKIAVSSTPIMVESKDCTIHSRDGAAADFSHTKVPILASQGNSDPKISNLVTIQNSANGKENLIELTEKNSRLLNSPINIGDIDNQNLSKGMDSDEEWISPVMATREVEVMVKNEKKKNFIPYLPEEIIFMILVRLPADSVHNFRLLITSSMGSPNLPYSSMANMLSIKLNEVVLALLSHELLIKNLTPPPSHHAVTFTAQQGGRNFCYGNRGGQGYRPQYQNQNFAQGRGQGPHQYHFQGAAHNHGGHNPPRFPQDHGNNCGHDLPQFPHDNGNLPPQTTQENQQPQAIASMCQICDHGGHFALECRNRFNQAYQSTSVPEAFTSLTIHDSSDAEWYPDSGATAHITNNEEASPTSPPVAPASAPTDETSPPVASASAPTDETSPPVASASVPSTSQDRSPISSCYPELSPSPRLDLETLSSTIPGGHIVIDLLIAPTSVINSNTDNMHPMITSFSFSSPFSLQGSTLFPLRGKILMAGTVGTTSMESSEGLQIQYIAIFLAVLFPGALVAFNYELLQSLKNSVKWISMHELFYKLSQFDADSYHFSLVLRSLCFGIVPPAFDLHLSTHLLHSYIIPREQVLDVSPASPLSSYLSRGDAIVSLDGLRIHDPQEWTEIIALMDE
ncbi:hypothetical protein HHK36_023144 [Tetracentron sinense]|uniref:DUF4283 domain-containing protein n=1 Tax=Tetracentron sinense TaxID=13715 RepID=A0A834YMK5_TETSI|nr:hypothetical protein HHK36_023144 [Tetracentron sinense]